MSTTPVTQPLSMSDAMKELEKHGLINQDLFTVEGELAHRYNRVLKETFGLECTLDEFRIDKRGLSPEVSTYMQNHYPDRFHHGENYLSIGIANPFMLVVSPDQRDSPLISPQTSYDDDVATMVHKAARSTIKNITAKEALFGELENFVDIYSRAADTLNMRVVEVTLETPNQTVRKLQQLRELDNQLKEGDTILNNDHIAKMKALVKEVGDYRSHSGTVIFPVRKEINHFYVEFFGGIHCFRGFKPYGDIETIVISNGVHNDESTLASGILYLSNAPEERVRVLDTLIENGIIQYDTRLALQRRKECEDELLLKAGYDVVEMTSTARKSTLQQHKESLPFYWQELNKVDRTYCKNDESTKDDSKKESTILELRRKPLSASKREEQDELNKLSYETRVRLLVPRMAEKVVHHLLSSYYPNDLARLYEFNVPHFKQYFGEMSPVEQKYVIHQLTNKK